MTPPQSRTPTLLKRSFSILYERWLWAPCSLQMYIRPESLAILNRLSLLKSARAHSYYVHFLCSWHYRSWRLRCASANGTQHTGLRAHRPPLCCLLPMVKRDIRRSVLCPSAFLQMLAAYFFSSVGQYNGPLLLLRDNDHSWMIGHSNSLKCISCSWFEAVSDTEL